MKPGYTFSSNCVNVMPLDGHNNSKQGNFYLLITTIFKTIKKNKNHHDEIH